MRVDPDHGCAASPPDRADTLTVGSAIRAF